MIGLRAKFTKALSGPGVYLANHSLGRAPDAMEDSLATFGRLWQRYFDDAWGPWSETMAKHTRLLAELIQAPTPDCVVLKSSTGQALRSVLNALIEPGKVLRVLTTTGEFDSIDFILKTYQAKGFIEITWVEPSHHPLPTVPHFDPQAIIDRLPGQDLLVVSMCFFATGQILPDFHLLVEEAHAQNVLVFADSYHAAGVYPITLGAIDFMGGGSYKYLRGGPGAAWLAINPNHLDNRRFTTLDTGWFAKEDTFGYSRPAEPVLGPGSQAWLEATPAVVASYQALPGLEITLDFGIPAIRQMGLEHKRLIAQELRRVGVSFYQPQNDQETGAFVLVPSDDQDRTTHALKSQGITVDARGGNIRIGPDFLTTQPEISQVAEALAQDLVERPRDFARSEL